MLPEESLFLHLYNSGLAVLFFFSESLLFTFDGPLCLVDSQFLLPQPLDLSLVLLLLHASLLSIHLLESLILSELLHEFDLELALHAFFLSLPFLLELLLILLGCHQLLPEVFPFLNLCLFLNSGRLLILLEVEFIAEVLHILLLKASACFLISQLLEYLFPRSLCLCLPSLDLALSDLLLSSILLEHLIFVFF